MIVSETKKNVQLFFDNILLTVLPCSVSVLKCTKNVWNFYSVYVLSNNFVCRCHSKKRLQCAHCTRTRIHEPCNAYLHRVTKGTRWGDLRKILYSMTAAAPELDARKGAVVIAPRSPEYQLLREFHVFTAPETIMILRCTARDRVVHPTVDINVAWVCVYSSSGHRGPFSAVDNGWAKGGACIVAVGRNFSALQGRAHVQWEKVNKRKLVNCSWGLFNADGRIAQRIGGPEWNNSIACTSTWGRVSVCVFVCAEQQYGCIRQWRLLNFHQLH